MMKRIIQLIIAILFSVGTQAQYADLADVDFLLGTWKMEGKETYESWVKSEGKIVGKSYKIKQGEKVLTETIEIFLKDGEIIYVATVLDQNEGEGVSFTLNTFEEGMFSFENLEHDFPKKIQYQLLDETKLFVSVLGKKNKGYTFYLNKQAD